MKFLGFLTLTTLATLSLSAALPVSAPDQVGVNMLAARWELQSTTDSENLAMQYGPQSSMGRFALLACIQRKLCSPPSVTLDWQSPEVQQADHECVEDIWGQGKIGADVAAMALKEELV